VSGPAVGTSAAAKKQAPGRGHRAVKAGLPDIDVGHAQSAALLAPLPAPVPDPARSIVCNARSE
jgi:hypothetical protein